MRQLAVAVLLLAGACNAEGEGADGRISVSGTIAAGSDAAVTVAAVQPPSGDRSTTAAGRLPAVAPIDVSLEGDPTWVLAAPHPGGLAVLVVFGDGTASGFVWTGSDAVSIAVTGTPGAAPPVASFAPDRIDLIVPDPNSPAPPTVTPTATWWTRADGSLTAEGATPTGVGLPDGRIVVAADGTMAALVEPTGRYPHGVLGDAVEAAAIAILEPDGSSRVTIEVPIVIEGISPMWVDLDGDGIDEVVVTESDPDVGAALATYRPDGSLLGVGPPIGRGSRWRHQIGSYRAADGTTVLVAVRTPHIGGVAEFYRHRDGELRLEAAWGGITSHVIGSRNLDLALVADADGDGVPELVAPTPERTALRGIAFDGQDSASTAWEVPLPGRLISNLAAVDDAGLLWLVAGIEGGVVRIWPPS